MSAKIPNIKSIVAKNLVKYRKQANMTQQQLADKIHYSDKAVSKWERGEALPDVYVLRLIAEVLGIELEDLLHQETSIEKFYTFTRNRLVIAMLSVLLVWLLAMISYVLMEIIAPKQLDSYLAFIVAIPISFIVALVFNNLWGARIYNLIIVSGLTWSTALSLVCCLTTVAENIWYLYLIAAIFQIIIIVWYLLDFDKLKKHQKQKQNISINDLTENLEEEKEETK